MSKLYYIGNFKHDAQNQLNRGWIVGSFMADGPCKTEDVEIKYWEFKVGEQLDHPTKISSIVECTLILKGETECQIDGTTTVLQAGNYIVIQPHVPNNTIAKVIKDVAGLTIKAPSDTTAKIIVK